MKAIVDTGFKGYVAQEFIPKRPDALASLETRRRHLRRVKGGRVSAPAFGVRVACHRFAIVWNVRFSVRIRQALVLIAFSFTAITSKAATTITKTNYHGWPNSYVLSNGAVEAIVVPSIGRVMQFKFVGEDTGPFFENRAMDGKHPIPSSKEWGNFGGDKTWPSPQDDWPKVTPRAWPPPVAFDSMPVEAIVRNDTITLVSPVDPHYGIRTERVIACRIPSRK